MNKSQLVEVIATKADISKSDAVKALSSMVEAITQELSEGDSIQLVGFGTFKINHKTTRKGRNPKTGAVIDIPQKNVPAFSAGKALKDAVNS